VLQSNRTQRERVEALDFKKRSVFALALNCSLVKAEIKYACPVRAGTTAITLRNATH
jgi:hypothetical protein